MTEMFFLPGWHFFFSDFIDGRTDGDWRPMRSASPAYPHGHSSYETKYLLDNWIWGVDRLLRVELFDSLKVGVYGFVGIWSGSLILP